MTHLALKALCSPSTEVDWHSVDTLSSTDASAVTFTAQSGWTIVNSNTVNRVGAVVFAYLLLRTSNAINAMSKFSPLKVTGARRGVVATDNMCGMMGSGGVIYARALDNIAANSEITIMLVLLI